MTTPERSNGSYKSLFRANAIRNYMRGKEETVLPRFVSPSVFVYLWILMALLVAATSLAWYIKYPVYSPTLALVVDDRTLLPEESLRLIVLLEPDSTLRQGDPIVLSTDLGSIKASALEVSEEPLNPADFRHQFELDPSLELMFTQPMKIAVIEIAAPGLPSSLYRGGFFQANVEVRSERVISLLPVIGKYF
jgi:hypothetical protein